MIDRTGGAERELSTVPIGAKLVASREAGGVLRSLYQITRTVLLLVVRRMP